MLFFPGSVFASDLVRVALWDADLARDGPGLLVRDLGRDDDQIAAVAAVIGEISPDILVLTNTDMDAGGVTLEALKERFGYAAGFAQIGNAGRATGIDMDGDGRRNTEYDTQGFGAFSGNGGNAVLTREAYAPRLVQDFTDLLWRDLPDSLLDAETLPSEAADIQRLSSTSHWVLEAGPLTLLVYAATPPVFDGPEDRNGRRNHDETMLWHHLLKGRIGAVPEGPLVLMGKTNTDLADGDGRRAALQALIDHPRLQDPMPRSAGAVLVANPSQSGDPALDTADFDDPDPGNLRVDYILPSTDLEVVEAGVVWPDAGSIAQQASNHGLVWMTLRLPETAPAPSGAEP